VVEAGWRLKATGLAVAPGARFSVPTIALSTVFPEVSSKSIFTAYEASLPLWLVMFTTTACRPPVVLRGTPVRVTSAVALPLPETDDSAAAAEALAFPAAAETDASNDEAAAAAEETRAEAEATAEAAFDASADGGEPENPAVAEDSAEAIADAADDAPLDPLPELPQADRAASPPVASTSDAATAARARPPGAVARA
jgi:hypothetical protein